MQTRQISAISSVQFLHVRCCENVDEDDLCYLYMALQEAQILLLYEQAEIQSNALQLHF